MEEKKNLDIKNNQQSQTRSILQDQTDLLLGYYKRGQYDLAENLANEIKNKYPNNQIICDILGAIFLQTGRLQEAFTTYQKLIDSSPNEESPHNNLGTTLQKLGRLDEAEISYKKAIAIKPEYAEAYNNLSIMLQQKGSYVDALYTVLKLLEIKPSVEVKTLFIQITKNINVKGWDQSLAELVTSALMEPWGRPSDIMLFACKVLKTDEEFIKILKNSKNVISQARYNKNLLRLISKKKFNSSTLLCTMLSSSHIPDPEIEALLTALRHHLLKITQSVALQKSDTQDVPPIYCFLAQQCFINEYVYFQTAKEVDLSKLLNDQLTKSLKEGRKVSAFLIIAVACYFPLYSLAGSEKLLNQNWSNDIKNVLKQQIQEPLEEAKLRFSIPVITSIENQVSLAVRTQYEENPYPRWVRLPKHSSKETFNSYIKNKFPLSTFKPLVDDRNLEILIAGCGTGQHPIGTSHEIKTAKILAVDLSIASLAYAKRKTAELEIKSIDYAQADLLKLSNYPRTFDIIESAGVLHHLENPFEGWKVLLSLLRPRGLMKLGFYSEIARQEITRVRDLISERGIGSSNKEIRDFRKYLKELKKSETIMNKTELLKKENSFTTTIADFFSTSSCRDLLFHTQEHRMNLKVLHSFLQENNLDILGFEINSSVIQAYKNRFPNDQSATNFYQWDIYEKEHPNTFIAMYQFWIQKNDNILAT